MDRDTMQIKNSQSLLGVRNVTDSRIFDTVIEMTDAEREPPTM